MIMDISSFRHIKFMEIYVLCYIYHIKYLKEKHRLVWENIHLLNEHIDVNKKGKYRVTV